MTVVTMGTEPIIGLGVIAEFTVTLEHGQRVVLEP